MSTQECVSLSLSTASTHSHMCKWSAPYHDPHHPALPAAYSEPHYPTSICSLSLVSPTAQRGACAKVQAEGR